MAGQLIFQPPTFHWPSEDQQMAFKEWQSHITLTLEVSNIPWERWYASIIGFLGLGRLQAMAASRYLQKCRRKKDTRKHLHCLLEHLRSLNVPVELHWWNVQRYMAGRTRNHWPAWSTHQDLGQEMWLCIDWREDDMPTGATISCDETLQS